MKCVVVIGTIAGMGGAEKQALYLVQHLSGLPGIEVEVLAFQDGEVLRPALAAAGVRVHVIEYFHLWPKPRRVRALSAMARLLRFAVRPDALLPFVGIHSKATALVWPYSGAGYCWWNQQDEGRDLGGTETEKRILNQLPDILSNSYEGRDFLVRTYGIEQADVRVYNNGTPLPAGTGMSGRWRSRPDLAGRPIVTMLANISPYKDHATLLKAWRAVVTSAPGASPALVLAGSTSDSAQVARLKTLAFDLGLSSSDVMFVGSQNDVEPLLADSDIVVHSSTTEGCPNSVCEAMAMARPVVATDISGCRQALGDGASDWLVPPGDAGALADRVLKLLQYPALRRELGDRNRARIASDFSVDAMNEFFVSTVRNGLDRVPAGAPAAARGPRRRLSR